MEPNPSPSQAVPAAGAVARPRMHPLVIAAALSIIALSGVGIATLLYGRSNASDVSIRTVPADPAVAVASPAAAPPPAAAVGPLPAGAGNDAANAQNESAAPAQGVLLSDGSILAPIEDGAQGTPAAPGASPAPSVPVCTECATVVAIHELKIEGEGTGLGAVGGGLVGGVAGNAVGGGKGRDLMTILGAVGGALVGNAAEKSARAHLDYELVVRYENGHTRRFRRPQPWPYSVGEPVRVVKGDVRPRNG